jgi:hypothetical protein
MTNNNTNAAFNTTINKFIVSCGEHLGQAQASAWSSLQLSGLSYLRLKMMTGKRESS